MPTELGTTPRSEPTSRLGNRSSLPPGIQELAYMTQNCRQLVVFLPFPYCRKSRMEYGLRWDGIARRDFAL